MITQTRLKKLLNYNPKTGVFTWLKGLNNGVKSGDVAGSLDGQGYKAVGIDSRTYQQHRLAWLYIYGEWPDQIDHINHNKADNRLSNIRNVSGSGNNKNSSLRRDNTSGYMGVGRNSGKWMSRIKVAGKSIHLGMFVDLDDAIAARKAAELKYGFHPNHGRNLEVE